LHKDKQNALKSLEKEVILSWKSLEENLSDFCTNPNVVLSVAEWNSGLAWGEPWVVMKYRQHNAGL